MFNNSLVFLAVVVIIAAVVVVIADEMAIAEIKANKNKRKH